MLRLRPGASGCLVCNFRITVEVFAMAITY